jgi:hypothetical protein
LKGKKTKLTVSRSIKQAGIFLKPVLVWLGGEKMKQYKNERKPQCSLVNFKHKHSFFVINFWEIVSIRIENFHASQGEKPAQLQSFIWGSYNLVISYLKYHKKEKITREKVLPRGFSHVFTPSTDFVCEESGELKRNLICEAEYSYRITPVSFFLFPLLNKIKFVPFKVAITVQGKINAVPLGNVPEKEHELEENNTFAENKTKEVFVIKAEETTEREGHSEAVTEEAAFTKEFNRPKETVVAKEETVVEKKEKAQKKQDLIAQEKRKVHTTVSAPNPQYYKTYRLFYEQFYRDQQVKGDAKKNK